MGILSMLATFMAGGAEVMDLSEATVRSIGSALQALGKRKVGKRKLAAAKKLFDDELLEMFKSHLKI